MKTLIKIETPKDLSELKFQGIKLIEAKAGAGGTDFKGIELCDSITGICLRIELGPYSDLNIYTEKAKEFKTAFVVRGKKGPAELVASFDTAEEAKEFSDANLEADATVTKEQREVV